MANSVDHNTLLFTKFNPDLIFFTTKTIEPEPTLRLPLKSRQHYRQKFLYYAMRDNLLLRIYFRGIYAFQVSLQHGREYS